MSDRGENRSRLGKIIPLPHIRRASLGLSLLEFSHGVVLMLWVGSQAGLAAIVVPVLFASLPTREGAAGAVLAILERAANLGCGAGAFLLLTTWFMHLLSLRSVRTTLVQASLLVVMTTMAVGSQLWIAPRLQDLLQGIPTALDGLAADDPARAAFARLFQAALAALLVQVAAGIGVLFFAVRRWYRYLPARPERGESVNSFLDPRAH